MRSSRTIRRVRVESEHRIYDIIGVLLLAAGLITLLSLVMSDTGIIGGAARGVLRALFGKGAWAAPVILFVTGTALLLGRRTLKVTHLTWGSLLMFAAFLGFIAKSLNSDYFDPDLIVESGGVVGAAMAWAFKSLLAGLWGVGLGAIAMVGAILCFNTPIQVVLSSVQDRLRVLRERRRERWVKSKTKRSDRRRAVVEMPAGSDTTEQAEVQLVEAAGKDDTVTPSKAVTPMPKEGYTLPSFELLRNPEPRLKRTQTEIQSNINIVESTLDEFGIEANVVEIAHGPTITRYEVQLGPGIRVSRIKSLADNLAMSLAASHVRVEAPIPGKAAIGVEVPNAKRSNVSLREVADSESFMNDPSRVAICLGQDVGGRNMYADLAKMPHLLIGGATNSGKSISLTTIVLSLILRNTPKDLRLVLLDPKRVELTLFDDIPHLMCPVVREVAQMPGVLRQVWREVDRRYDLFAESRARNIEAYNDKVSFAERLPYVVVVIDELADLMIQAANEVETSICRIAQLARATGIHLVFATQRPSVDVITGTIKANISSRIAFAVSSQVDSRTILDCPGADQLLGCGDMLFLPIDASKPVRIQGCYVHEEEIIRICRHWREQADPEYSIDPAMAVIERKEARMDLDESDPYWEGAVRWVVDRGQASTSMLQRRFSIGFQRASRLLDLMEERGIVAPRDGPRPREVLISPSETDEMLGRAARP